MGHAYTGVGGLGNFTVVKSNPSGNVVRFTITDSANLLTTTKMIRAVLADAMDQFIAAERADLDTNGDSAILGSADYPGCGDGFKNVDFVFASKYCDLTLSAKTNIAVTGNITVAIPYGDV